MNIVFGLMVVAGLVAMLWSDPAGAVGAALSGAENAVSLSLKMIAIYALWLGVLGVMRQNGVAALFSRVFRPLTRRLFRGESDKAHALISQNLAANFLGIGSAATPLGIEAVAEMQGNDPVAKDATVLFLVLNACGVQLLPATIIALRGQAGSESPSDILLPTVIATLVTALIGVALCFLTRGKRRKKSL